MSVESKNITYTYHLKFPDGTSQEIAVELDRSTLTLVKDAEPKELAEWTRLEHHKCSNCPIEESSCTHCPAAVSVQEVMRLFAQSISYEDVEVRIVGEARSYVKSSTMQKMLGALMGLYMVTSGCPIMGKMRPLVLSHLPFATREESSFRFLAMYLLAQYFVAKRGGEPDWSLNNFIEIQKDIHLVNQHFHKRLSGLGKGDAYLNALVTLDIISQALTWAIEADSLENLETLFGPYLEPAA